MGVVGRTLVYEVLNDARLVVSCQPSALPTDAEWNRWLMAVADLQRKHREIRLLVVSDGGHPTRTQIERLRTQNDTNPLTAIVSSSRAYRFMASALTFINPKIRCFAPSEITKAFGHLDLASSEYEPARKAIEGLRRQLEGEPSPATTVT